MSLIDQLTNLELKVLPAISKSITLKDIQSKTNLQEIEIMRCLQWLSNKDLIEYSEDVDEFVNLDENGIIYSSKGLPENQILQKIKDSPKSISQLEKEGISKEEINISIGQLKKKVAINLSKNEKNEMLFEITKQGLTLLDKESLDEKFLKNKFPILIKDLKPEERFAYDNLLRRKKILKLETKKTIIVNITKQGEQLKKEIPKNSFKIDKLTPEILKSDSWKNKEFRSYDVKSQVPKLNTGKIHFVNQAINYIKKIWLELGFEEMTGNHVQTAFRDLDALFVPQDHPAREMQDTFYINNPSEGKIPEKLLKKVKDMHENGSKSGSTGWKYNFSQDVAKQNLLRTHTTVLSAIELPKLKKEDLPKKYFSVGKVYRNESLDWKHLFEFYQVEGIVVDPNANFRNLIGYLKEFYKKMGFEKVRIRPAHFPYTEPSAEIEVFHPIKKQWIELGGAGIFRPEVVIPLLGEDIPVLAWGNGMERGIVDYFNFTDLRDLYKNDIKQLREIKSWIK